MSQNAPNTERLCCVIVPSYRGLPRLNCLAILRASAIFHHTPTAGRPAQAFGYLQAWHPGLSSEATQLWLQRACQVFCNASRKAVVSRSNSATMFWSLRFSAKRNARRLIVRLSDLRSLRSCEYDFTFADPNTRIELIAAPLFLIMNTKLKACTKV